MSALRRSLSLLFPAILIWLTAHADTLAGKDLIAALRTGGYVIVMRHASSPRTPPDAAHANPDNIGHERQLDETGRSSARAMGEALRALRIPFGDVLSSPTYRALETLRLAGFEKVTTAPELGDSGQSMQADSSGARGAWVRSKVAQVPRRGTDTLMVTHFPNLREAFPENVAGLGDGEALIFVPDGHGGASLVARVKIEEWPRLAANR